MHPEVGVGMDDLAFGNVENFGNRRYKEREVCKFQVLPQKTVGLATGKNWAAAKPIQSLQGRRAVAFRVIPFDLSVEMIVRNKPFP